MKYAVCCDSIYIFNNEVDLKKYFKERYSQTNGPLKQRYASLLRNYNNKNIFSSDGLTEKCKEIIIKDDKYSNMYISLDISEAMTIQETIDYFENIIQPILEISNKYNVHFINSSPFQDFGSDEDAAYGALYSFSNYYKEILEKLNLDVKDILTEEIRAGKYSITINNEYEINTYSDEKLAGVINNIESLKTILKDKEEEIVYE